MSVAAGGSSESAIGAEKLLALGIIGGLLGIYLVQFNPVFGPVLASLGAVCAIIWGADAIRRVASYGLGTGVPSIGYMSLSIGVIGALAGIGIVTISAFSGMTFLGPILGLIFAMIIGLIVAVIAKKIVGMKIPVLERCTAEIAGAAALSVLGFSAALAGTYQIDGILTSVVAPGFIAVFFIMNTMAIQHPFNACLGPNETQLRTLKLAVSTGFLAMFVTGILTIINPVPNTWLGIPVWVMMIVISGIGWLISIRAFINASYEEAASVKWSGLWPKVEEQ
jgi:tetrahydromethanopterin S-methyltransferase subunit C